MLPPDLFKPSSVIISATSNPARVVLDCELRCASLRLQIEWDEDVLLLEFLSDA